MFWHTRLWNLSITVTVRYVCMYCIQLPWTTSRIHGFLGISPHVMEATRKIWWHMLHSGGSPCKAPDPPWWKSWKILGGSNFLDHIVFRVSLPRQVMVAPWYLGDWKLPGCRYLGYNISVYLLEHISHLFMCVLYRFIFFIHLFFTETDEISRLMSPSVWGL